MELDDGESESQALLLVFFPMELEEGPDGLDVFGAETASLIGYCEFAAGFICLRSDGDGGSGWGEFECVIHEFIGQGGNGVFLGIRGEVIDVEAEVGSAFPVLCYAFGGVGDGLGGIPCGMGEG